MNDKAPEPGLSFYLRTKTTSVPRYLLEGLVFGLLRWAPGLPGILLRGILYRLVMRIEGFPVIEPGVLIDRAAEVFLGRRVFLARGVRLSAGPGGIRLEDRVRVMPGAIIEVYNYRGLPAAEVRIGAGSVINSGVHVRGQGGVRIGRNVTTGPGVKLMAGGHQFDAPGVLIKDQPLSAKGIEVGDDALIYAGAIVLDGVKVGDGAVIGAGSVVTREVPPGAVCAGVPARTIRYRPGYGPKS